MYYNKIAEYWLHYFEIVGLCEFPRFFWPLFLLFFLTAAFARWLACAAVDADSGLALALGLVI
jgi:hypothetical protein